MIQNTDKIPAVIDKVHHLEDYFSKTNLYVNFHIDHKKRTVEMFSKECLHELGWNEFLFVSTITLSCLLVFDKNANP